MTGYNVHNGETFEEEERGGEFWQRSANSWVCGCTYCHLRRTGYDGYLCHEAQTSDSPTHPTHASGPTATHLTNHRVCHDPSVRPGTRWLGRAQRGYIDRHDRRT